jgi:hypothetical protein
VLVLGRPRNVPVVTFSKEAVQHAAADEKPISVHLTKMSLSVAVSDGNGAQPYIQPHFVYWLGCAEVAQPK